MLFYVPFFTDEIEAKKGEELRPRPRNPAVTKSGLDTSSQLHDHDS